MKKSTRDVPSEAFLPTKYGDFRIQVYHEEETGLDHVALVLGSMTGPDAVLVRIHSECLTGDVFGSTRCDCGPQLEAALEAIVAKGWGVLLYLRQEGRGIGLHAKIQAYHLQDEGADTMDANLMLGLPADGRNYAVAVNMLTALGVSSVNLLTNNPEKVSQLKDLGIRVDDRTPLVAGVSEQNRTYLTTKVERMGHLIDEDEL
jgi:3,4-dihydroxy 2-butanone 4-phosphate synthase/GTP cyclohydrolase II